MDGQLFVKTDHTIKCVAAPVNVRAEPQIAPLRGSTVMIHGNGLASAPDPACRFGRDIVPGKRVDLVGVEAVECDAPSRRRPENTSVSVAADASALAFSPAVPFTYFSDEVLVSVNQHGPPRCRSRFPTKLNSQHPYRYTATSRAPFPWTTIQ